MSLIRCKSKGYNIGVFSGHFFVFLKSIFYAFFVALCDLVLDVETIFHHC